MGFYLWTHLKTLVYAAPVDSERIVDACRIILNYPGIFETMLWSKMRRVNVCIESHKGKVFPVLN
jgi:hypothetical protein